MSLPLAEVRGPVVEHCGAKEKRPALESLMNDVRKRKKRSKMTNHDHRF